jgi:hypothetical protein
VLAAVAACLLLAGCASADKGGVAGTMVAPPTATASSTMSSMSPGAGTSAMVMPSRDSNGGTVTSRRIGGLEAVPTTVLASTTWQGMRITAEARSAVAFLVDNGTKLQEVKPGPRTSFHLMVMLNDAQTAAAIPYASVWATITKAGRIVYDDRQWPMIARYMGPHYGNNVTLPGPGAYDLTLLVSPPAAARHLEYAGIWLHPHRVSFTFHWHPAS